MALVVTYLIWTGVSETMVYYLTPVELMARVAQDQTFHEVGVKVSGRVERGSWSRAEEELLHHFTVIDLLDESVRFPVEYREMLPDTFNDTENVDVVVEGRFRRMAFSKPQSFSRNAGVATKLRLRNCSGDNPRRARSLDCTTGRNLGSGRRLRRRAVRSVATSF